MLSETVSTSDPSLPPRAGIALLTLQLRAALNEAAEAESAGSADHDAARDQLRARLHPLLDERRRALDQALFEAQAHAHAKVAAAHRAAAVLAIQTTKRAAAAALVHASVAARSEPAVPTVAAFYDEEPIVAAVDARVVADPAVENALAGNTPAADTARLVADLEWPITQVIPSLSATVVTPCDDAMSDGPVVAVADTAEAPADVRWSWPPPPPPPPTTNPTSITTNLVIDAEAFATVFATVFASVLDERLSALGTGVAPWHGYVPAPIAPAPVKQSFWAHARHTDVLLLTFAMIIGLVILAAWLA